MKPLSVEYKTPYSTDHSLRYIDQTYFFEQSLKFVVTIFSAWPAELVTLQTYSPLSLSDNCLILKRPESSTSTRPFPRPAGKTAPKFELYRMKDSVSPNLKVKSSLQWVLGPQ